MTPENRTPTHPGEVLLEEFLKPRGVLLTEFAKRAGFPAEWAARLVRGDASVTSYVATQLSVATGTSWYFWMNLQANYDEAAR